METLQSSTLTALNQITPPKVLQEKRVVLGLRDMYLLGSKEKKRLLP
ncbi:hypothetical protein SAMN05216388_100935 [Halorientalis persicus]|uniref:Uncharacterized protein n=1 Tax=Halorientalis persicus TaxID=1367881 RepID=A0A1H8MKZ2_9EURY|nr:hypothetical protein SAMN05216388_100935 [Halorientalis persicus]